MTKLPADLEALMPEPAGFRTRYRSEPGMIGHYPWTYADATRRRPKYDRPEHEYEDLFIADQVREAMLASHINALDDAYNAMFDLKGDKVTRFDAQTAIRKLKDAAAIRSGGEAGS